MNYHSKKKKKLLRLNTKLKVKDRLDTFKIQKPIRYKIKSLETYQMLLKL